MKSVGMILKHGREKAKISLEQLADRTKIQPEYVQAIEADDFTNFPSEVAIRGFITLYAKTVGIEVSSALAVYRRDQHGDEESQSSRVSKNFFVIGKKRIQHWTVWTVLLGLVLGFSLYGIVIVRNIRQAPSLSVNSPQNDAHVVSPFVVKGITLTDAVVEIDGEAVGVTQDGEFAKELDLAQGPHVISIRAKGRNGKENFQERTITVDPQ
ncbi:MAG: helix-turn-helix domain-containing protein [Candidatus Woesebacteria bacterium]